MTSYATDGRCHNAEPGTYGHECGKPAVWLGTKANGCASGFCDDCREHGAEAGAFQQWERVADDRYIARVSRRDGRKVYETIAFTSRDEAATVAFAVRPSAKTCSTARASFVGGRWQAFGFDIRWHDRRDVGRAPL